MKNEKIVYFSRMIKCPENILLWKHNLFRNTHSPIDFLHTNKYKVTTVWKHRDIMCQTQKNIIIRKWKNLFLKVMLKVTTIFSNAKLAYLSNSLNSIYHWFFRRFWKVKFFLEIILCIEGILKYIVVLKWKWNGFGKYT